MDLKPIDPDGLTRTGPVWSQAIVAGDFVFVSGQVAWDADGRLIGGDSVSLQTEAVFDNLECALSAAGSAIDRLVRICVYLVDRADLAAFRSVRDRRLQGARPASTLVIVEALVDDGLRVEVDAVAALCSRRH
jgi:enamine deaminase RidA (YjgF/YER057c/UK114 family)